MSGQKTRAKYGYLSYNDMLTRISEGILDEYDVVYTTDTKECYVITPDLIPMSIKSKVYVFDSLEDAETQINLNTDTYPGQLVSVYSKNAYKGYIVNDVEGTYSLTPLSETVEEIDYNTLGNKPIISMIGTLDEPIILTNLLDGIYSIKGQYQITETDETVYLGASYLLFHVEQGESVTYIKKITSNEIIDYKIENDEIFATSVITQAYLKDHGYVTEKYVDDKLSALDVLTKEEAQTYVEDLVKETIGTELDTIVDTKIDEKIQPMEQNEITMLFT